MSEHDEVMRRLDELKEKIEALASALDGVGGVKKQYYGVKDIASYYGKSYAYMVNHPWLLPRGGESDLSPKAWSIAEFKEWDAKPIDEKMHVYKDVQDKMYLEILNRQKGGKENE